MWNVDSFLSWKLTGQSGRDWKSHSDFVCFYWGRHSKWHPQYNTSIKSNDLKLNQWSDGINWSGDSKPPTNTKSPDQ